MKISLVNNCLFYEMHYVYCLLLLLPFIWCEYSGTQMGHDEKLLMLTTGSGESVDKNVKDEKIFNG